MARKLQSIWKLILICELSFRLTPCFSSDSSLQFLNNSFSKSSHCVDSSCAMLDRGIKRSKIECSSLCAAQTACSGFKYNILEKSCFHLRESCYQPRTTCLKVEKNIRFYEKPVESTDCLNGGLWIATMATCRCAGGWVGFRCERYPYNCQELAHFGYPSSEIWVQTDLFRNLSYLAYTYCRIVDNQITFTNIFRSTGSKDNNRTWIEYVNGFKVDDFNYWLGLRNIRLYNGLGYNKIIVCVVLGDMTTTNYRIWWKYYDNFVIQGESSGYSYTVNVSFDVEDGKLLPEYKFGDILTPGQGALFSTFDTDQDNDKINVAATAGAGWWFKTLSQMSVNPLGRSYKDRPSGGASQHVMLPGLNMSDPRVSSSFTTVHMYYHTSNP